MSTIFEQFPLWQELEAANDPAFDTPLYAIAKKKREDFQSLDAKRMRQFIGARQHWRCLCGRRGYLEIDHWLALVNGGDNSPSNLRMLCPACHALKTTMDKQIAARRQAVNRKPRGRGAAILLAEYGPVTELEMAAVAAVCELLAHAPQGGGGTLLGGP